MGKTSLITGVTGQDGAYLAKLLIEKGYKVYGAHRRSASLNLWRLIELGIADDVELVPMELLEFTNIGRTIEKLKPDEIYNLGAQSFVAMSFEQPIYTCEVSALGVARLVEAIRYSNARTRFYQASTSEMFGKVREVPQTEETPFHPRSPYGVAKLMGHWITVNYRESFGIHASSGILFNHESPLRGLEFVTRKITSGLANVARGHQEVLELGNLNAQRDWGHAADYVEGMWLMLQQDQADDYVLCNGETHTVRAFVEVAGKAVGFDIEWRGKETEETGVDRSSGRTIVRINPAFYRPGEVDLLIGDNTKARERLGWKPRTSFEELVHMMARADYDRASNGKIMQ